MASAGICLLSGVLMAVQPAALAWLTIFPRWLGLIVGVVLLLFSVTKSYRHIPAVIGVLWIVWTVTYVEETWSLVRGLTSVRDDARRAGEIRVVTFNCGDHPAEAAAEAFACDPDVILFQESPSEAVLTRLTEKHWGAEATVAWGRDCSIVARGRLTKIQRDTSATWIRATWTQPGGEFDLVSLRLTPVDLRFDIWSSECWRSMTSLRDRHRTQVTEIVSVLQSEPPTGATVIGGDFNAPAYDPALSPLSKSFRDAFTAVGVGWGNTIVNDVPVHRIDQVWLNFSLKPTRVRTFKSRHSDHRLVMCDFLAL